MYCCLKSYSVLHESRNPMKHYILFSVSLSVSFCMFLCSKGHFITAYIDTIQMTLAWTATRALWLTTTDGWNLNSETSIPNETWFVTLIVMTNIFTMLWVLFVKLSTQKFPRWGFSWCYFLLGVVYSLLDS